jgi:putative ABC transport system permease protein
VSVELGPILRSLLRRKSASALLLLEVAVGMVVLVHNLVLGRYYAHLAFMPSGIDEADLVYVTRRFGVAGRSEPEARAQVAADLQRLAGTQDVAVAAALDALPFPDTATFCAVFEGQGPGAARATGWPVRATDGVTDALGLPLREGRKFAPGETGAAILSRRLARRLFPRGSAVGRTVVGEGIGAARVVGVTEDFRIRMPFAPDSGSVFLLADLPAGEREVHYAVGTAPGRRDAAVPRISAALAAGAPAGDTLEVVKFDSRATRFHRIARGATIVVAWMSLIVVGVALAGALAVASFSVAERTRQIGVRRAIGASRTRIVAYFLVENALLTGTGIAAGMVLAVPASQLVRSLLPPAAMSWFDVAISAALLFVAGLLSALVPALRAARIPPTAATRIL